MFAELTSATVLAASAVMAPMAAPVPDDDFGTNPCPTMVASDDQSQVALVCDDGIAVIDLNMVYPDDTYYPVDMVAGSHTVSSVVVVGDEVRVWFDDPWDIDMWTSYVTILNLATDEVRALD